jgi:myosin phosphatase Rho-interacting protein
MSSVRREILALSEKYSLKCMEAAQLEEQLASSSRQLQQSQQIISELEGR